jgi:hypothetical protein
MAVHKKHENYPFTLGLKCKLVLRYITQGYIKRKGAWIEIRPRLKSNIL